MRQYITAPRVGLFAVLLLSAISINCNPCRFGYFRGASLSGARGGSVGCCGAFLTIDATVDNKQDYEMQLSSVQFPGRTNQVDIFVTEASCDRLFDGPYPADESGTAVTPRCRIITGPVSPGSVGPRVKVSAGTYRVFIQSWTVNTESAPYQFALDLWGRTCSIVGYSPTY